jgi:hypothetical protein
LISAVGDFFRRARATITHRCGRARALQFCETLVAVLFRAKKLARVFKMSAPHAQVLQEFFPCRFDFKFTTARKKACRDWISIRPNDDRVKKPAENFHHWDFVPRLQHGSVTAAAAKWQVYRSP